MKLLLEGSLSETLTLKDLLTGILQAEAPGVSVLQLFIEGNYLYGEIFFLGGHFVVACNLATADIAADEAFNHLLQLKDANFYYYACDSLEALPANKPLKIDLKELLGNWQVRIPISSNDLLDKIFNKVENTKDNQVITARTEIKEQINASVEKQSLYIDPNPSYTDPTPSHFTDKQSQVEWELVNPLLVGGAPGDIAIGSIGNDWEDNQASTHGLRSLATGWQWQRKLRDLILILLMLGIALVVILCFGWLLLNSPYSEISSKLFSMQPGRHGVKRNLIHSPQR